MQVYLGKTADC